MAQLKSSADALVQLILKESSTGIKDGRVKHVNSCLSFVTEDSHSDRLLKKLEVLVRQPLLSLYKDFPVAALRFSAALYSSIARGRFKKPTNTIDVDKMKSVCWESVGNSILSGVIDFLESCSDDGCIAVAASFFSVLHDCHIQTSGQALETGAALTSTVYTVLSEAARHPSNKHQLRSAQILGGTHLGIMLSRSRNYLVIEALLTLLARLLPSIHSQSGLIKRETFIRDVFASFQSSQLEEECVQILMDNRPKDLEDVLAKLFDALARYKIKYPQPFTLREIRACGVTYPQTANSERLHLDTDAIFAIVPSEDGVYENFQVSYSSIEQVVAELSASGPKRTQLTITLSSCPMVGDAILKVPVNQAPFLEFDLKSTDVDHFYATLLDRGLNNDTLKKKEKGAVKFRQRISIVESPACLSMDSKGMLLPDPPTYEEKVDKIERLYETNLLSDDAEAEDLVPFDNSDSLSDPLKSCLCIEDCNPPLEKCPDSSEVPPEDNNSADPPLQIDPHRLRRLDRSSPEYKAVFGASDEELSELSDDDAKPLDLSAAVTDSLKTSLVSGPSSVIPRLPSTSILRGRCVLDSQDMAASRQNKQVPEWKKAPHKQKSRSVNKFIDTTRNTTAPDDDDYIPSTQNTVDTQDDTTYVSGGKSKRDSAPRQRLQRKRDDRRASRAKDTHVTKKTSPSATRSKGLSVIPLAQSTPTRSAVGTLGAPTLVSSARKQSEKDPVTKNIDETLTAAFAKSSAASGTRSGKNAAILAVTEMPQARTDEEILSDENALAPPLKQSLSQSGDVLTALSSVKRQTRSSARPPAPAEDADSSNALVKSAANKRKRISDADTLADLSGHADASGPPRKRVHTPVPESTTARQSRKNIRRRSGVSSLLPRVDVPKENADDDKVNSLSVKGTGAKKTNDQTQRRQNMLTKNGIRGVGAEASITEGGNDQPSGLELRCGIILKPYVLSPIQNHITSKNARVKMEAVNDSRTAVAVNRALMLTELDNKPSKRRQEDTTIHKAVSSQQTAAVQRHDRKTDLSQNASRTGEKHNTEVEDEVICLSGDKSEDVTLAGQKYGEYLTPVKLGSTLDSSKILDTAVQHQKGSIIDLTLDDDSPSRVFGVGRGLYTYADTDCVKLRINADNWMHKGDHGAKQDKLPPVIEKQLMNDSSDDTSLPSFLLTTEEAVQARVPAKDSPSGQKFWQTRKLPRLPDMPVKIASAQTPADGRNPKGMDINADIINVLNDIHQVIVEKIQQRFKNVKLAATSDGRTILQDAAADLRILHEQFAEHYDALIRLEERYASHNRKFLRGLGDVVGTSEDGVKHVVNIIQEQDRRSLPKRMPRSMFQQSAPEALQRFL